MDKVSNESGLEMFKGTQKSQFYLGRDHACEVTLKNVYIFHVLIHKSITTSVSEIPVQLFSLEYYLEETYLTCHQCVVTFERNV